MNMPHIYSRSKPNTGVMTRHEDREFRPMSEGREKKPGQPWISPFTIRRGEMETNFYGDKSWEVSVTKQDRNTNAEIDVWEGYHILEGTVLYFVEKEQLQEFLDR